MRIKIILIVVLLCAVFASLTVDTLSSYTASSGFGISISPDTGRIGK